MADVFFVVSHQGSGGQWKLKSLLILSDSSLLHTNHGKKPNQLIQRCNYHLSIFQACNLDTAAQVLPQAAERRGNKPYMHIHVFVGTVPSFLTSTQP